MPSGWNPPPANHSVPRPPTNVAVKTVAWPGESFQSLASAGPGDSAARAIRPIVVRPHPMTATTTTRG